MVHLKLVEIYQLSLKSRSATIIVRSLVVKRKFLFISKMCYAIFTGRDRFRTLNSAYFRGAHGILLVTGFFKSILFALKVFFGLRLVWRKAFVE